MQVIMDWELYCYRMEDLYRLQAVLELSPREDTPRLKRNALALYLDAQCLTIVSMEEQRSPP